MHLLKILSIIILVFNFYGCHSHSDGDTHNHSSDVEENHSSNDHSIHSEDNNIAALSEEQLKTINIQYGSIVNKQLTATLKVTGKLKVPNNNKANVTTLYSGVVKSLNVELGDYVKKGHIIATVSNAQFLQLQEEYLSLNSKIVFSERELQRQKELNNGNAGVTKNLQSAEAELNSLQIKKSSLHQQLLLMGINPTKIESNNLYSELSVRSPINGYISNILSKIGSYVDASTPLAEIVDNGQLHLDINVFEKDLPLIKVGQIIHFNLTNNPTTEYDAQVYSIGSSFEDASKTIPVHCKIKGKNKGLIDGMSITALVSLNDITSPSLPSEAIVSSEGKYYIFIVTDKQMEEHKENNENHNEQNQANEHVQGDAHKHLKEKKQNTVIEKTVNFEKIEVLKGVTYLGFTAITPMTEIPKNAKIVTKGAFFVNAKMVNQGEGHNH